MYWLLQVIPPGVSDRDMLQLLFQFVLFSVPALATKKVTDWVIRELNDRKGKEPVSPRTQRWLAWAVSFVLPSALYALYCFVFTFAAYSLETHVIAVLGAFGVSQVIHGQTELPSGADVRAQEQAHNLTGQNMADGA